MIAVTYTPPNGKPLYGIMLQRDSASGLIEVAFDQSDTRPFSIGWLNPFKQIGKITMQSNQHINWKHRALRLIEAKNIKEARDIFSQEEDSRRRERARKEYAT